VNVESVIVLLKFCRDRNQPVQPVLAELALDTIEGLLDVLTEATAVAETAVTATRALHSREVHLLAENAGLRADLINLRAETVEMRAKKRRGAT